MERQIKDIKHKTKKKSSGATHISFILAFYLCRSIAQRRYSNIVEVQLSGRCAVISIYQLKKLTETDGMLHADRSRSTQFLIVIEDQQTPSQSTRKITSHVLE
jgi:hypothetical protein